MGVSCWPDADHFADEYPAHGIKAIVNVSEFDYPDGVPAGYAYYHLPIPDYGLPTRAQVDQFLEITDRHVERAEPVVVHCVAGCGRTGQMVAIWGAATGRIPKGNDPVRWIRARRPCSCETREQEKRARAWARKYAPE